MTTKARRLELLLFIRLLHFSRSLSLFLSFFFCLFIFFYFYLIRRNFPHSLKIRQFYSYRSNFNSSVFVVSMSTLQYIIKNICMYWVLGVDEISLFFRKCQRVPCITEAKCPLKNITKVSSLNLHCLGPFKTFFAPPSSIC